MKPIEYKHTLAIYHKIKADLDRISYILLIGIQCVLFLYYSYAIYSHHDSLVYILLYSGLLCISTFVFVEAVIYHKKEKKTKEEKELHKKRHTILKIIGLLNKIALLIVSIIPIVKGEASDFSKITTLAIAILILFQTAYLFVIHLIEKYLSWLKQSLELDYKDSFLMKSPGRTFQGKLHDYALNLKEDKDKNPLEEEMNEMIHIQEKERQKKKEEEKKQSKLQMKEDFRNILSHFKESHLRQKISEEKVKKEYLKLENKAEKLLKDEKKLASFISIMKEEMKVSLPREELSYIEEYLFYVEEEKSIEKRKKYLVNLLYYEKPLVKNEVSIEDNLMIQKLAFSD